MYSEHECGICYQTYNAGRRCPRELHCKHSFCESCLLALSRPRGAAAAEQPRPGADRLIVCPLCRNTTSIPGEENVRTALRVDESVLERLIASGVLDQEEEEEDHAEEDVRDACDDAGELPETPAEESDFSPGSRGGKVRRCCRKVWRVISGKSLQQRNGENCMTNDDFRNLAMMSCHMF